MCPDDLKAATDAIRDGIKPTVFVIAKLDPDPFRDARVITEAALAALFSAGFTIVRKDG